MKKSMKAIPIVLLTMAMLFVAGCGKDPDNGGGGNGSNNGNGNQSYTISVVANPNEGGSVSGGGVYEEGESCTVTATPASGYTFTNWTEEDQVVSVADTSYTFSVQGNRTLVAHFQAQPLTPTYTISVSADPNEGGSVSGGGIYDDGQSCTLTATPANGYTFTNWTEDDQVVSGADTSYTFSVQGNRTLVAHFQAQPLMPEGALNGIFTVNSNGDKVYFSKGNLQYIGSIGTWKFADNQWDVIGTSQSNSSQGTARDLFGWGTSGYNHGANCYQPWSTSANFDDYCPYSYYNNYNLYDQSGEADWGYNAISNGGNTINTWRTLTGDEWAYVFNTRTTTSGVRYAKACVNNMNGVILLPDDWNTSYYSLSNTNNGGVSFSSNTFTITQWNTLEKYGAVFLPAAGRRVGTWADYVGLEGSYWSASYCDYHFAFSVWFTASFVYMRYISIGRPAGCSVRLVRSAQ